MSSPTHRARRRIQLADASSSPTHPAPRHIQLADASNAVRCVGQLDASLTDVSPDRRWRRLRLVATTIACALALGACSTTDLVVGDDSPTFPDGSSPIEPSSEDAAPSPVDGAAGDAGSDAKTDSAVVSTCAAPANCIPSSEPCKTVASSGKCASANEVCCAVTCPVLSPPAPTFCDGGPIAPLYNANGCIVGYACAPVACATAGGQCVGLSPTSCPNGQFGDANKYSCGPGIGTACCLPK